MHILENILAEKHHEIADAKNSVSEDTLFERIESVSAPRGFVRALNDKINQQQAAVIAEIKKASPSKGVIREDFDPVDIAKKYEAGGATCLSVLTDKGFFQGHNDYLTDARNAVNIPVLRKDFIIDPYQVIEARSLGADCILLIMSALLLDQQAQRLHDKATELGMDVLVEVHNADELKSALDMDIKLVGINNRDLNTFDTSLDTTINLLSEIPDDVTIVTESGIHSAEDVAKMLDHDVYGFLVGEAFMRQADPGKALQSLFQS